MSFLDTVNKNVLHIIEELVHDLQFASYETVTSILLDRYDHSPTILNIISSNRSHSTPATKVDSLQWLWIVNAKTNAFLEVYFSSNAMYSIHEIDRAVSSMLDSFLMPSYDAIIKSSQVADVDPNEIDVDDVLLQGEEMTCSTISGWHDEHYYRYGIGSITWHPRMRAIFPYTATSMPSMPAAPAYSAVYNEAKALLEDDDGSYDDHQKHAAIEKLACMGVAINMHSTAKQTRRHQLLLLKSYRVEPNHHIQHHASYTSSSDTSIDEIVNMCIQRLSSNNTQSSNRDEVLAVAKEVINENRHDTGNKRDHDNKRLRSDGDFSMSSTASAYTNDNNHIDATGGDMHRILINTNSTSTLISDHIASKPPQQQPSTVIGINVDGKLVFQLRAASHHHTCTYIISNQQLSSISIPYPILSTANHHKLSAEETGRWGEALVYHYLLLTNPDAKVIWLNQHVESRASYDVMLECNMIDEITKRNIVRTTFIEVKSTRSHDRNICELSLFEWQFATSLPRVQYHVYRVFGAGDPQQCYIKVIKDILASINEGTAKLCLAV